MFQCQRLNPNHFRSADGMLSVLCATENYYEAYGWALLWHDKFNDYQRAIDVILEIRDRFANAGLEFIEKYIIAVLFLFYQKQMYIFIFSSYSLKFNDPSAKRSTTESSFPPSDEHVIEVSPLGNQNKKFPQASKCDWFEIGNLLKQHHQHSEQIAYEEQFKITFEEIYDVNALDIDNDNNKSVTSAAENKRLSQCVHKATDSFIEKNITETSLVYKMHTEMKEYYE